MLIHRSLVLVAALLLAAGTADAQLRIHGQWYDNRGPDIDIPTGGGAVPCQPGDVGTPSCPTSTVVFIPHAGGVGVTPGKGGVPTPLPPAKPTNTLPATVGVAGAPLTVPPNIFDNRDAGGNPPHEAVAVPTSPQVRQLNTSFTYTGPIQSLSQLLINDPPFCELITVSRTFTTCFNAHIGGKQAILNNTRMLAQNQLAIAQPNRPGPVTGLVHKTGPGLRTGMTAVGPAGWATATTSSLGSALNFASVRYVPSPNQFGGTMLAFLRGNGQLIVTGGALGTFAGINNLGNLVTETTVITAVTETPMGATNMFTTTLINPPGGTNNPAGGGTWGWSRMGGQPAGPLHLSFQTAFSTTSMVPNPSPPPASLTVRNYKDCSDGMGGPGPPFLPVGCELVTALGPVIAPSAIPAATSIQFGFPWTTGMVRVSRTGTQNSAPLTSTISATGADFINSDGNREIHLVAGSMSIRTSVGGTTGLGQLNGIEMVLVPEPSENALLAAALGVIGLLSLFRRRL